MALLSPEVLKTVVALGSLAEGGEFQATGTGFLFAYRERSDAEGDKTTDWLFLVTNKHVVEGAGEIVGRVNLEPESDSDTSIFSLGSLSEWTVHPDGLDVAAHVIPLPWIQREEIEFAVFMHSRNALTVADMKEHGLSEGDGVFLLGFPLGLAGKERNHVIVRQGAISRIKDVLVGRSDSFLIDAPAYPGNSGGPVMNRPVSLAIDGTQGFMRSCLIGMVSSYLTFQDIAVGTQTKQARVIFEENTGLAYVIPVDHIYATVEEALERLKEQRELG